MWVVAWSWGRVSQTWIFSVVSTFDAWIDPVGDTKHSNIDTPFLSFFIYVHSWRWREKYGTLGVPTCFPCHIIIFCFVAGEIYLKGVLYFWLEQKMLVTNYIAFAKTLDYKNTYKTKETWTKNIFVNVKHPFFCYNKECLEIHFFISTLVCSVWSYCIFISIKAKAWLTQKLEKKLKLHNLF